MYLSCGDSEFYGCRIAVVIDHNLQTLKAREGFIGHQSICRHSPRAWIVLCDVRVMYEMGSYRVVSTKISRFLNSRSGRYALPFLLLVVGGSFGLKKFTEIRYTYGKTVSLYDQAKESGIEMKKPGTVTLDTVYESVKDLDINNWENKRGPRPWENENEQ